MIPWYSRALIKVMSLMFHLMSINRRAWRKQ